MKEILFERSFASNPKSDFWSDKNKLQPNQVTKCNGNKFWFDCTCGHSFESSLSNKHNNKWCPYCANPSQKLCNNKDCKVCLDKSFASHPKSIFWSEKNKVQPNKVFKNTNNKYWFNCYECNHVFESSLNHIINGKWCPYCTNQKLCNNNDCKFCLEKSFATHPQSKFWSNKNNLTPRQVFKSSGKKYLFNCNKCNHIFETLLYSIINGTWCSYCSNKQLCNNENCQECYNKSFESHIKSKFWSSKNILQPRQVFKNCNEKFLFDCKCGHSFESALNKINDNKWCPYCANPPQKLCNNENCKECLEKSFYSHEKSKFWSDKNILNPRQVFKSSGKKYLFDCICGHFFECTLNGITNGSWCPFCSNPPKKLCDNENCQECYNKSFESNPKSKFWSKKNILLPRQVFKSSHNKYIFDCDKCNNEFISVLSSITSGKWCPYCKHKTELKLYDYLKEKYKDKTIKQQPKFE